jgi:uncharacterized protein
MAPDGSGNGTQVTMHTSMNVTGRPAQFGRGVMVEVGGKLVEQFAANLAKLIAGGEGSGSGGGASVVPAAAASGVDGASAPAVTAEAPSGNGSAAATPVASTANGSVTSAPAPAPEDSLNLVKLVGPALLKRLAPVAVGAAALALLGRIFWRRRRAAKA